ncbi:MAG: nuclear transport factor 2 family protein [Bauldia sp.]|nr:MAG: nuclear transport factor 2 family protein [Bauldia sp.]
MPDTDRLVGAKGVRAVIARYNQAWADHDLDAIMALHTEDSVFENHTSGGLGIGREQIRKIIEGVFATFPDIAFSARRQYFGEDFAVQEWTATATFARPIVRDGVTLRPTGEKISWNGVDILPVAGGRVARKDVYVDTLGYLAAIGVPGEGR